MSVDPIVAPGGAPTHPQSAGKAPRASNVIALPTAVLAPVKYQRRRIQPYENVVNRMEVERRRDRRTLVKRALTFADQALAYLAERDALRAAKAAQEAASLALVERRKALEVEERWVLSQRAALLEAGYHLEMTGGAA